MHSIIGFPMATKQKGEKVKGIRMEPSLISRINKAGGATGIRSFSDQVRHLLTLGLAQVESGARKAA